MNTTSKLLIIGAVITLIIFILVIIVPINRNKEAKPLPTPTKQSQAVEEIHPGVVDEESGLSQTSAKQIDKISSKLPFSVDFHSSTGDVIRVALVHFSLDPPSILRLELGGNIDLENNQTIEQQKTATSFAQQLQNFREAAQFAFDYIDKNGADHTKITISWGTDIASKNAQAWLVPSDDFPEVVKNGGRYEFK